MALILFTTVIAPGSAPLNPRQTEILALVTVVGGALSTSDVRTRVNEQRRTPLGGRAGVPSPAGFAGPRPRRARPHPRHEQSALAGTRASHPGGLMTEVAVHKPRSVRGTSDAGRGSQSERHR